jgi:hypothetical protein
MPVSYRQPSPPGTTQSADDRVKRLRLHGFTKISNGATAVSGMSDAAFRAWVVLDRWAWSGDYPTNAQLAEACGWLTKAGRPSTLKAKRALWELEALKLVERVTVVDGGPRRVGVRVKRAADWGVGGTGHPAPSGGPDDPTPGPDQDRGRFKNEPGGGPDLNRGGGSDLNPSEDGRMKKLDEDPCEPQPRIPSAGNNVISQDDRVSASGKTDGEGADPETAEAIAKVRKRLGSLTKTPRGSRGHAGLVDRFAKLTSALLLDEHSHGRYCELGWKVVRGETDPGVVVDALIQVLGRLQAGPEGERQVGVPGSYFFGTLRGIEETAAHREVEAGPAGSGQATALGPYDDAFWPARDAS